MQRLFSDFNQNIKAELAQVEKASKKTIKDLAKKTESSRKDYLAYANAQGSYTRRINRYKNTDPALANSLEEQRADIEKLRLASKTIYNRELTAYNKATGKDYNLEINVFEWALSSKEENRSPLVISKKRLLASKNPAALILRERKKRLAYELKEATEKIEAIRETFFDTITPEDLKRLKMLEGGAKGLGILLKKTKSALDSVIESESGRALASKLSNSEDEDEDEIDEDEDEDEDETKDEGSANVPLFYVPLNGYIDIL